MGLRFIAVPLYVSGSRVQRVYSGSNLDLSSSIVSDSGRDWPAVSAHLKTVLHRPYQDSWIGVDCDQLYRGSRPFIPK